MRVGFYCVELRPGCSYDGKIIICMIIIRDKVEPLSSGTIRMSVFSDGYIWFLRIFVLSTIWGILGMLGTF